MKRTIKIEGMHCDRCKVRLENALGDFSGMKVNVDLDNGTASIEAECLPEDAKLKNTVEALGFDVLSID